MSGAGLRARVRRPRSRGPWAGWLCALLANDLRRGAVSCAALFCALVPALLLSCGRVHLKGALPHAVVDARAIDFGATPLLFPVLRTVLVTSAGAVPLHLRGLQLSGSAFEAAPLPSELPAGQTAKLAVTFRPAAQGPFSGTLAFDTDDADLPHVTIALAGVATAPGGLAVRPGAIDFGRVGEGLAQTRELEVTSTGPADLYLASFGLAPGTPDAFGYVGSVNTPATLAAGARLRLAVRFAPTPATAAARGALAIASSDPAQPLLLVPLSGSINRAPLAIARGAVEGAALSTGPLSARVGANLVLDALASTDPDGDLPLRYAWTLLSRPAGSTAAIAQADAAQTSLRLDAPGVYSAGLTVTDATGLVSFTPGRLDVAATPAERLVVQLVWDQLAPDLDLHFLQQGAQLNGASDCFWANPNPVWFAGTADQNPHHLGDKLTGYGPETVTWKEPAPGTYALAVAYKSANGAANTATGAQVRIYAQGVLVADLAHTLSAPGEVWNAGTVEWPSGKVTVSP